MNQQTYLRVLGLAHAVRLVARQVDRDGELDDAIAAIVAADSAGAVLDPDAVSQPPRVDAQDEATLRAVRVLARLGEVLAGEEIASEPRPGSTPADGSPEPEGWQLRGAVCSECGQDLVRAVFVDPITGLAVRAGAWSTTEDLRSRAERERP